MKKIIIWCLILFVYLFGIVGVVIYSSGNVETPSWLVLTLMFTNTVLIFYPAFKHWEKYFKKLFDYYGK